MIRESLVLHKPQLEPLNELSIEDKGRIFDAIVNYQFNGINPDLPGVLMMAFKYIKNQLDIDNRKYDARCERNRENGKKGGRPKEPKKPSGLFGNPTEPKKAENENENENDLLFKRFWNEYDKKRGKTAALKLWRKLSETDQKAIFEHLPSYIQSTPDKSYRKDPERYLRNQVWKDEIIHPKIRTMDFQPQNQPKEYEAI